MSADPIRLIGPAGSNFGSSNRLYASAQKSRERKDYGDLARDTHWLVSEMGRRVQMTLGRKLFADYPTLENAILEEANLSVGHFIPIFTGTTDRKWGKLTRSWLCDEWFPICDFRGSPYDADTYLDLHVISECRDGDMATLLTETSQGYPAFQTIPSHRIRSPLGTGITNTALVRFEDDRLFIDKKLIDQNRPQSVAKPIEFQAWIFDGAIMGPQGQKIAYRVCDGDFGYGTYTDVSARNCFLNFHPKWADQVRGFSLIGSGGPYWQNMKESRDLDLIGQKVAAAMWMLESNERGAPNSSTSFLQRGAFGANGEVAQPTVVEIEGGIRYVRNGSGSKIEFPTANRPSMESQKFQESVLRDAMSGLEWSYIFGVDPGAAGGASLRVVVERINRVLAKRRKSPAKSFKRLVGYAISKAMDLKILPWSDEWWRWRFLGPGDVTADAKYDSDVAIQNIDSGLGTEEDELGRMGMQFEDVTERREIEVTARIQSAQRIASATGLTWQEAMEILRPKKASTPAPANTSANGDTAGAPGKPGDKTPTQDNNQ